MSHMNSQIKAAFVWRGACVQALQLEGFCWLTPEAPTKRCHRIDFASGPSAVVLGTAQDPVCVAFLREHEVSWLGSYSVAVNNFSIGAAHMISLMLVSLSPQHQGPNHKGQPNG